MQNPFCHIWWQNTNISNCSYIFNVRFASLIHMGTWKVVRCLISRFLNLPLTFFNSFAELDLRVPTSCWFILTFHPKKKRTYEVGCWTLGSCPGSGPRPYSGRQWGTCCCQADLVGRHRRYSLGPKLFNFFGHSWWS